ncbi:MAG: DUF3617 family protein [Sterolibacterium sp.]|nr:DUF3617 family protein [Sterolibacterium sp.]MBP9799797.1 DUF3617 family protein [Sterolibacterium sp.]
MKPILEYTIHTIPALRTVQKTCLWAVATLLMPLTTAHAAPGSYWEITTKMDMPGMPIAMPAMTIKTCVPNGGEKNPQYLQKKDDKCKMTDIRTTGNKVSWKATCTENGETMTGTGEVSHERDSFRGNMHMQGKSHGQAINMTQTYSGKKIGGTCDSEEQLRELKKIADNACDSSRFTTNDWITRASLYLGNSSCPGKKEPLCAAVRRDAARDTGVYQMLIETEKSNNALITSNCNLNLEALRVSVCKANREGNYSFLKANCPTEAKEYREMARKKNCEGRSYTARNAAGCQGGNDDAVDTMAVETSRATTRPAPAASTPHDGDQKDPGTGSANTDAIIEGAKKLKGLFGF